MKDRFEVGQEKGTLRMPAAPDDPRPRYEPPHLRALGSVHELTQGGGFGLDSDGLFTVKVSVQVVTGS